MPRTTDKLGLSARSRGRGRSTARGSGDTRLWLGILFALAVCLRSADASAVVHFEGDWPATEEPVSLSVEGQPRAAAIRQLAERAGWSVVLEAPAPEPIELLVRDQPPAKVLEALLREGSWTARRDGSLVSIARATAGEPAPLRPTTPAPSASVAAPAASAPTATPAAATPAAGKPQDRVVAGSSVTVKAGETVRDLVVMGGAADVSGTVTGDLVVFGGTATVRPSGHVVGDCAVFGGSLDIEAGGVVDGDQVAFGGTVRKDGEVVSGVPFDSGWQHHAPFSSQSIAARLAHGVAHAALLFLFGAFLLAVAGRRMEALQVAFAARPLRSLLQGLLAGLLLALAILVLAVTCIGIPFALTLLVGSLVAASAGLCAILATVGTALVRHRSENPYLHLAVGCALYALIGVVPILGGISTFLLGAMGLGIMVCTRGAGLWASANVEAA